MSSLGARGIARARGREREGEKRERKERGRESFLSNFFHCFIRFSNSSFFLVLFLFGPSPLEGGEWPRTAATAASAASTWSACRGERTQRTERMKATQARSDEQPSLFLIHLSTSTSSSHAFLLSLRLFPPPPKKKPANHNTSTASPSWAETPRRSSPPAPRPPRPRPPTPPPRRSARAASSPRRSSRASKPRGEGALPLLSMTTRSLPRASPSQRCSASGPRPRRPPWRRPGGR